MSVDLIMYRLQKLNADDIQKITGMNIFDLNGIDDCGLKAYSAQEVETGQMFERLKNLLVPVELLHTTTDYKGCFVAHGMPEDIQSYSWCYNSYLCRYTVIFGGISFHVTREDMEKFIKTEKKLFYVVKQKHIDVDIDGWLAKTLRDYLDEECYMPIRLDDTVCQKISSELIRLYDEGELYANTNLVPFLIELMRTKRDSDIFIEFQN